MHFPRMKRLATYANPALWCGIFMLSVEAVSAMQVTGYTAAQNDRFASGFPTAPVNNTNALFVGLANNWSSVGWDASNVIKGFGFLSPSHYLVARHFGGATNVRVFDSFGILRTGAQLTVKETTYGTVFSGQTVGDISLGTLTSPLANISRYGVLDLNASSTANTPTNYSNLALLVCGRGIDGASSPRIAATTVFGASASGNNQYFLTPRTGVQLELNDSGSPAFANWTNPNGAAELAILGNNAAVDATYNIHNFIGTHESITALNNFMTDDGRALRVVGNYSNTWVGSSSTLISNRRAWTPASAPIDTFVLLACLKKTVGETGFR